MLGGLFPVATDCR